MSKRQKKTLIRILISAAIFVSAILLDLDGWPRLVSFLIPYFLIGYDVLWESARNIARGQVFDENFLMSIATIGAMFTADYAEGVAVMLFYQVGELFQSYAVGKSRRSIAALMDIRPDHANVIIDGEPVETDPEEVPVGAEILIRPGERVPLDAVVISGTSSLNTSALTGESAPRDVFPGDELISGSININGVLTARVKSVYSESTVARILELVENSADKKAKMENFITRFAGWYTPAVVIGAVLLAVLPPIILGGGWADWIHRALVFLVVSCPCALVISVPLSFFGGIGGAAKRGILIKGSNYLEALSKTKTVVFDKTGTLTEGTFTVSAVYPEGMTEKELLNFAVGAELYSTHPIARALKAASEKLPEASHNVEELAGLGVRAEVNGREVHAGNRKLMESIGAQVNDGEDIGTVVYVAVDKKYAGKIVISDRVKKDSASAVKALYGLGVTHTAMLTGDRRKTAEAVGRELGIDEILSELLPGDKVSQVERLLSKKDGVLTFVGDGINDAPVLTRADVGVAMGALGSDAAIEAADIVLMDDKLSKLPEAIRMARKTMSIVWQNIIFALSVKGVILILGALGYAGMWLAVFADVGVAVIAILNAMRALTVKKTD